MIPIPKEHKTIRSRARQMKMLTLKNSIPLPPPPPEVRRVFPETWMWLGLRDDVTRLVFFGFV